MWLLMGFYFSCTTAKMESFLALIELVKNIIKQKQQESKPVSFVFVGNKTDEKIFVTKKFVVDQLKQLSLGDEVHANLEDTVFESSAKTGTNVESAFLELLQQIHQNEMLMMQLEMGKQILNEETEKLKEKTRKSRSFGASDMEKRKSSEHLPMTQPIPAEKDKKKNKCKQQ